MHNRLALVALGIVAGTTLRAQDSSSVAAVERVAIRAAVRHAASQGTLVAINPVLVREGTAPGYDSMGVRPVERERLLAEMGIPTRRAKDVILCIGQNCELSSAILFVSASEPRVVGDKAEVTVTIYQQTRWNGRKHTDYETIHYTLARRPSGWIITGTTQLGIS